MPPLAQQLLVDLMVRAHGAAAKGQVTLLLRLMVGAVLSTVWLTSRLRALLASAPSLLKLAAASLNLSDPTLMLATVPLLADVKVAVQTSGLLVLCVRPPRLPPVTTMSSRAKSLVASERVKVTVAV